MNKRFQNDGKASVRLNSTQIQEINLVKEKIAQGTYQFIDVACPVCGENNEHEWLSEKDRYGFYFPMKICKSCGLVFANPRFRDEDYEDFYVCGHQKRVYVGSERPSTNYFTIQYNKGKNIFSFVKEYLPKDRSLNILEVGCGAGGILKVFEENNHIIKGIDLNPEYIKFGKDTHKLNLSTQNLFDIKNEKYDLIIYSHVLEHLTNPGVHLEFIKDLLTEEGLVYIEVPGIKNCFSKYGGFHYYLQNAHVMNFSLTSLINLMHKSKYKLISQNNEVIQSLWKLGSSAQEGLLNDYSRIMNYLKWRNFLPIRLYYFFKRKFRFIFG